MFCFWVCFSSFLLVNWKKRGKKGLAQGVEGKRSSYFLYLIAPVILLGDLLFLLGSEVIFDVEESTDLLGTLSLQHRSYARAREVQKIFNIQKVCRHDDVDEGLVLLLVVILYQVGEQKRLIPRRDHIIDAGLERLLDRLSAVIVVVLNVLEDIAKRAAGDIRHWDHGLALGLVLKEILDKTGHACGLAGDEELYGLGVII